jgi:hypothetical protein
MSGRAISIGATFGEQRSVVLSSGGLTVLKGGVASATTISKLPTRQGS